MLERERALKDHNTVVRREMVESMVEESAEDEKMEVVAVETSGRIGEPVALVQRSPAAWLPLCGREGSVVISK